MARSLSQLLFRPKPMALSSITTKPTLCVSLLFSKTAPLHQPIFSFSLKLFSTRSSPYPLQYDMIINRPTQSSLAQNRRRRARVTKPGSEPDSAQNLDPELGLDSWVDQKLSQEKGDLEMDKSKRKYYNKRRKRMYGSDSDEDSGKNEDGFVELKPEVAEFYRLHKREEELYFYDTFAYPWERDKHYKMVYQLEKKYFPDQCLDRAFVDPKDSTVNQNGKSRKSTVRKREERSNSGGAEEDKKLVFFEKEKGERAKDMNEEVTEKKVEDFFKCLKKAPNNENAVGTGEPYLVTRNTELPPSWDDPHGTVILINKPKGWTSFTVCGKLRRLVKVKKVGHAGTLDPMATGLLIVCVGKATKWADSYQGMIKGYSGVFRLGEATSTWDADSPVIQREPWEHVKDGDIKKAAASFCGEIWQVPPMFSAIKVGGEKMYEKARRGESVELSPRRISIFQFDIERSLEDRQNLIFRVTCSKGTYIRSLCADFGKALGTYVVPMEF
uniref:tRNA pseudouridine(55) synthase n=1 Tax=Rhizophora mucronata TaxID=61149 RepID=A0A2P2KE42_RHIMU